MCWVPVTSKDRVCVSIRQLVHKLTTICVEDKDTTILTAHRDVLAISRLGEAAMATRDDHVRVLHGVQDITRFGICDLDLVI